MISHDVTDHTPPPTFLGCEFLPLQLVAESHPLIHHLLHTSQPLLWWLFSIHI